MTCKNATKWYNTAKPLTKPCTRLKKHYHQIVQSEKKIKSNQDLSIIISMYKVVQTDINIVQFNWKMLYNIKSNITWNIFQNTIQNIVNWVVQCVQRCTTLIKKVVQLHIKYLWIKLYGVSWIIVQWIVQ